MWHGLEFPELLTDAMKPFAVCIYALAWNFLDLSCLHLVLSHASLFEMNTGVLCCIHQLSKPSFASTGIERKLLHSLSDHCCQPADHTSCLLCH